jgi:thiosulfate/3-mercaptopyruvate sulfurtransferase
MPDTTLIPVETLSTHLEDPRWVVVDCRFSLADTGAGRRAYRQAHIPGAVYVHLDEDLSGPPTTDRGRHPLPPPERLVALFARLGIGPDSQVVVYDDAGGAIAARLWWMLHYMGHEAAAVLDGGWQAWQAADLPVHSGFESRPPRTFRGSPRREWLVRQEDVPADGRLVDSRAPERYRGEVEPLDPVAGHIPGALNYHYQNNLDEAGRFLPVQKLQEQLAPFLAGTDPSDVVYYCGSGVTACHNILAQVHAGLPMPRLYVGSWSEWCRETTAD